MSQAKVDRYKEEKKNRKKIQKKQKAKQVVEILVCAAILGARSVSLWADMHIRKTMRHARQIRQSMHRFTIIGHNSIGQLIIRDMYSQQQAIAMLLQKMHLQQMQNNSLVYTLLKWDI